MKKLVIIVSILLITPFATHSQNSLFISFNKEFKEVLGKLDRYRNLKILDLEVDKRIELIYAKAHTTYNFFEKKLYKVEMSKYYRNPKAAERAFYGSIEYFRTIRARELMFFIKNGERHYIASRGGTVFELISSQNTRGHQEVTLISKFVNATPEEEWEHYDYLIEDSPSTEVYDSVEIQVQY